MAPSSGDWTWVRGSHSLTHYSYGHMELSGVTNIAHQLPNVREGEFIRPISESRVALSNGLPTGVDLSQYSD